MVDFKRALRESSTARRFDLSPIGIVLSMPMPTFKQVRFEAVFVELLTSLRPKGDVVGTMKLAGTSILLTLFAEKQLDEASAMRYAGRWLDAVEQAFKERGGELVLAATEPSYQEIQAQAADRDDLTRHPLIGLCGECRTPQYQTPYGPVCANGHGGAETLALQNPQAGMLITKEQQAEVHCNPVPEDLQSREIAEVPTMIELAPLSAEQADALQKILRFQGNSILTGEAGSGKSHVIKHLAKQRAITITGTTAKAALLVDGITVDRLFCFNRDSWTVWNHDRLDKNMAASAEIIVIDEGSMAGHSMLTLIYRIAKKYRKRIVLVGDWAQASPVKDEWAVHTDFFKEAQYLKLTECHRQADGPHLQSLRFVRRGEVNDFVRGTFQGCLVDLPPDDEHVVRMYATNKETNAYNDQRLLMVVEQTPIIELMGTFHDMRENRGKPYEEIYKQRQLEESPLAHKVGMRCGARVLMVVNDLEGLWVNGDAGTVEDIVLMNLDSIRTVPYNPFNPPPVKSDQVDHVVVRLDRTGDLVKVTRIARETKEPGSSTAIFAVRGFPIRLGWAVTIHRAQGATLDRAFVDMRSILHMQGESKHGLAYVALSRTRTLQGLQIANWADTAVYCSEVVRPYV